MSQSQTNGEITNNGNSTANGDTSGNGKHAEADGKVGLGGLIEEALVVRDALQDALARSNRLVSALKRYRRQSRLMATTLASLRELQQIET